MLRRILGPKRMEVTGRCREIRNENKFSEEETTLKTKEHMQENTKKYLTEIRPEDVWTELAQGRVKLEKKLLWCESPSS